MTELPELTSALSTRLARDKPRRLIAAGDLADALLTPYAEAAAAELVRVEARAAFAALEAPYDLALVAGGLEALSAAEGSILIGTLRDRYARRVWVVLQDGAPGLSHRDLIGHGFSRAGRYPMRGETLSLYEFDIGTYKTTPDWLNSRSWANPQLFDKYRW